MTTQITKENKAKFEEWREIPGYDGLYWASSKGRIKSRKCVMCSYPHLGRQLVALFKEGKHKKFLVHRLIGFAFIPNPDNKPQINHIDGNPSNNEVSNLEWCTGKENMKHASDNGLFRSLTIYTLEQGHIRAVNLLERKTLIKRSEIDMLFELPAKEETIQEPVPVELSDSYTLIEVQEKYGISERALYDFIKRKNIPRIKQGWYTRVPKTLIDQLLS